MNKLKHPTQLEMLALPSGTTTLNSVLRLPGATPGARDRATRVPRPAPQDAPAGRRGRCTSASTPSTTTRGSGFRAWAPSGATGAPASRRTGGRRFGGFRGGS